MGGAAGGGTATGALRIQRRRIFAHGVVDEDDFTVDFTDELPGGQRRPTYAQAKAPDDAQAVERLRAWAADDPTSQAREAGDRLWFLWAAGLGGGWFPDGKDYERMMRRELPDAHVEPVADGFISRPDEVAGVIRRIMASAEATAERP